MRPTYPERRNNPASATSSTSAATSERNDRSSVVEVGLDLIHHDDPEPVPVRELPQPPRRMEQRPAPPGVEARSLELAFWERKSPAMLSSTTSPILSTSSRRLLLRW